VLLDRYGVRAHLVSYHEHNERERAAELVARMRDGAVVALVSDAGTPLVSDPGFVLVQGAVAAGLSVEVLPGPSAAVSALVVSALPADRWRFVGFLPRRRGELEEVFRSPETVVAFESPRRVAASLGILASVDADRRVAVVRELTKVHEELAARFAAAAPRGEVAVVVGRAPAGEALDSGPAVDAVLRLVEAGARPRVAASVVADLTGVAANALYRTVAIRSHPPGQRRHSSAE
jgi:16S rRNA (cytidine1402-2'-O)-methyltransferase